MSIASPRFAPLRAGTDPDRTPALVHRALLAERMPFVAVDEVTVNCGGAGATVDRPQPLPEGVEPGALGVPGTPEPEFAALTALVAALARWTRQKRVGAAPEAGNE